MKKGYGKHLFAEILVFVIITSLILVPSVKALNFIFSDSSTFDLTVSGSSSEVKSGDSVVFTVSLTLNVYLNGNAHVRIWLYNSSLAAVDLVNEDVMASRNWTAGSSFNQPFKVVIPDDVANNNYVFAAVDVGAKHFYNLNIALVQNPTYAELQTQVTQLQGNVNSLTTQLNTLQGNYNILNNSYVSVQSQLAVLQSNYSSLLTSYNELQSQLINLQNNNASLQAQINSLISDKTSLLYQIETLQVQLSNLSVANSGLQSQLDELMVSNGSLTDQISNLQGNNSALQTQLSILQLDKEALLIQVTDLQVQVNALNLSSTNLQAIVTNFGGQIESLHEDLSIAQSENGTTSILLYIALAVAVVFIVATASIIILVLRKKKDKLHTVDAPLY